jgi:hypothetical protein
MSFLQTCPYGPPERIESAGKASNTPSLFASQGYIDSSVLSHCLVFKDLGSLSLQQDFTLVLYTDGIVLTGPNEQQI